MSFTLKDQRHPDDDLRRVLAEQYHRAIGALAEGDVHRVRTSCKRARGVLSAIGNTKRDQALARLDERTRSVGRAMEGARDAEVMAELVKTLAQACSVDLDPIIAALDLGDHGEPGARSDPAELADELEALAREAADLKISSSAPWKGVRRAYRKARDRMPEGSGADPTALHDWRKAAKRHWYHVRLLRRAWPAVVNAWADELDTLGELLGDHHDLAVLGDRLGGVTLPEAAPLLAEAERRQGVLERKALAIGGRAFAAEPDAIVEWFQTRWDNG